MASLWQSILNLFTGKAVAPTPTSSPRRSVPQPSMTGLDIHDEDDRGNVSFGFKNDYFVTGRFSPNRRYLVGARDGHQENGRVRSGQVALIDLQANQLRFKKSVKRAHNPWVSNEGLVSVENWIDWGGPLAGEVHLFDPSGERLWKKRFKANLYSSGMSAGGSRMFISTCNSGHEPHSCKTWLVDVRTGDHIWERPGFGDVRFEADTLMIGVDGDQPRADNRFFPLREDGSTPEEFDLARRELSDRRNRGKPWWVFSKVEAALKDNAEGETSAELVALLDEMEGQNELDDKAKAKTWRYRGELAEREGQDDRALECWTKALAFDPKVGIKKRHAALEKRLGGAG